jgi:hypothetical protein
MLKKVLVLVVMICLSVFVGMNAGNAAEPADMQKQIDDVKAAIPKFAIPMREVGDRFQDMYFAAKGGNWGLAAYMSKYMDSAMKPAKLTKPAEYPLWVSFYADTFAPVQKTIMAQDWVAFDKAYMAVIKDCNNCHVGMGYGFIKVVKQKVPADMGIDYSLKSKAIDVPK